MWEEWSSWTLSGGSPRTEMSMCESCLIDITAEGSLQTGHPPPKLFVGPGEKLVLRTWECDAIWVWRKFIDDSGQDGINCAIFRNESNHRSSDLVRQADRIADHCWPGERHYTYVDAEKITSVNPGFCFKAAGWRTCGRTKSGKVVLERVPQ